MEQQNQAANDHNTPQDQISNKFMCRQSSSRWTPTTDQIRILKELYYTNGMRSPTAEQIQRISARLRQYGKIEGKNVFYWFQNHKARERQKKRFTSDHQHQQQIHYNVVMQRPSSTTALANPNNNNTGTLNPNTTNNISAATYHQQQEYHHHHAFHHHHVKYSNLSPVIPGGSTSSASVVGVNGQMGNYSYGYSGVANLEKAFREQCGSGGSIAQNFGWVGSVDPYSSPYTLVDKRSMIIDDENDHDHDHGEEDDHDQTVHSPEIETLPLFPMHGEDIISGGGYYAGWYASDEARSCHVVGSRASLELTLNSYGDSL